MYNDLKMNIVQNLNELGLELTPEQTKAVTKRITELGDRKELVTQDDLPYIVSCLLYTSHDLNLLDAGIISLCVNVHNYLFLASQASTLFGEWFGRCRLPRSEPRQG